MRFVQAGVLVLGAVMYGTLIALNRVLNYQPDDVGWNLAIVGIWNLLLFVVFVIAIVDAAKKLATKKRRQLATGALVVKLASIPFFVLNFAVLFTMFFLGLGFFLFGGVLVGAAATVGTVLTYLTMLSTSVYLWAAIAELRRERLISIGLTVLYSILSLLSVGDIVAGVLVFGHARRRPRLALIVVLLTFGALLTAVGIAGYFLYDSWEYSLHSPDDPYYAVRWLCISVSVLGVAALVATGVVSFLRRATLKREAQLADSVVG